MSRVPPTIESRFFGLAPPVTIGIGVAAICAGGALVIAGQSWIWAAPPVLVGLLFCRAGAKDLGVERRIAAEVRRARDEWSALEHGIHDAEQRDQASVAAFLRDRGYRQYVVRRWILAEFGADISLGGSPRDP